MKYRDLQIQTQREAPNNARTEGFAFLVRAGYLTREYELTSLGKLAIEKLRTRTDNLGEAFFSGLAIPVVHGDYGHIFFLTDAGRITILKCSNHHCDYADRVETACAQNFRVQFGSPLPVEKVHTPGCNTIESLAKFLHIEPRKTAKAVMLTRVSDGQFVFAVVRGDTQVNLHKLQLKIGEVRPATEAEILAAGAIPGYASPIGIKNALIVVDEVIPLEINLAAGANEKDYHLLNTNHGRDYTSDMVFDIVQAEEADICVRCEDAMLGSEQAEILVHDDGVVEFNNILLALAEAHHDEKGLTIPHPAAPFDVHLMHVPGKEFDTHAKASEIYDELQNAGMSVLFDDRDERAGVKFNDADLIGCPIRVTVGEKGLKEGMVELKPRKEKENRLIKMDEIVEQIKIILK
jgi:prolyl-tRNA synthetase